MIKSPLALSAQPRTVRGFPPVVKDNDDFSESAKSPVRLITGIINVPLNESASDNDNRVLREGKLAGRLDEKAAVHV